MVQVKKESVRQRILATANSLFEDVGYVSATISQIAKRADLASSTIYVYFPSKLDMAVAIFEPWLADRIAETRKRAQAIESHRERLEYVLSRIWHDIPLERNNYLNSLMQALALSNRESDVERAFLERLRTDLAQLISDCLPDTHRNSFDVAAFAHLTIMAFDGFIINRHLNPSAVRDGMIIRLVCDLVLGSPDTDPAA